MCTYVGVSTAQYKCTRAIRYRTRIYIILYIYNTRRFGNPGAISRIVRKVQSRTQTHETNITRVPIGKK